MYDPDIGCYDYEPGHCMKPFRIRMTHDLVMSYGLYRQMEVYVRRPRSLQQPADMSLTQPSRSAQSRPRPWR